MVREPGRGRKLIVNRYVDDAEGVLEKNSEGRMAVTRVTLRPAVEFRGTALAGSARRTAPQSHRNASSQFGAHPGDRRAALAARARASF